MAGHQSAGAARPVGREEALAFCRETYDGHGKLEILPKVRVTSLRDMAVAYTPGVGYAVQEILSRPEALAELTGRDNCVAIVTDGTAVLGLGRAGPRAALPVMEGKATMFKMLVGIDCMPLCVQARDPQHLVDVIRSLEPTFGGFNLEDVAAPGCFEVMAALEENLQVPAIHDDQYGTATVIAAALNNALRVTGRRLADQRVVVNGAGAAGSAAIALLQAQGVGELVVHDRAGILSRRRRYDFPHWDAIAATTNAACLEGDLAAALRGADVFIGLSVARQVTPAMVRAMRPEPIVFALANPEPEIRPDEALAAGAAIVASGRFDFPNHCNNVLAFPSLMRGALDTRARRVSHGMCLAAARSIAAAVGDAELGPECLLPSPLSPSLYGQVSEVVARAAVAEGLARHCPAPGAVEARTNRLRQLIQARQASLP